jgi:cell wall-associated NlpC family hydrolase
MDLVPGGEDLIVKDESIPGWVGVVVGDKMGYVSTEFVELRSQYVQAESREEEAARLKAEEEARKKAAAQAAAARQRAAARTSSTGSRSQSYTAPTGGSGASVANFALQFVGNPYVYGGSSLTNGTDCSGFVMSVYSNFGVGLPHSSGAQRGCGYGVSVGEAQPGDIMCYSGHVGIYIGNGQMVHASTSRTGIIVSGIGSPIAVRRILS